MFSQYDNLPDGVQALFRLIWASLWPNPQLYRIVGEYDRAGLWLSLWVPLIAGCSLLLGYGGILVRRQPRGERLLVGLCLKGLVLVGGAAITAGVIWIGGRLLFSSAPSARIVITLTALSYAPLLMGFLAGLPSIGTAIETLLYTWSALVLLVAVWSAYGTSLLAAGICVGAAFLLRLLANHLGGRVMERLGVG